MTIKDIAKVQHCITKLDITGRDAGTKYLHRWVLGERAEVQPPAVYYEAQKGRISLAAMKINIHGNEKKNGQSEMCWDLDEKAIPTDLLNAEVTSLSMSCTNGIAFTVTVDILLNAEIADRVTHELERRICGGM